MAKNKSDIVYTVMDNGSYWKVSYKENELSVCFNVISIHALVKRATANLYNDYLYFEAKYHISDIFHQ